MRNGNRAVVITILFLLGSCATKSNPEMESILGDTTFGRYTDNLESNLLLVTVTPEFHSSLVEHSQRQSANTLPLPYVEFLKRMNDRYGLKRVAYWPLPAVDIYCMIFETEGDQSRDSLIAVLATEPGIETAQPVERFITQQSSSVEYNDPLLSLQHGFHSIKTSDTHPLSRGAGVRIAVIDTGMDHDHPDLSARTEVTKNFVDKNEVAFRSDRHGTGVGGIIAATADNGAGIVGVAPEANILALKACWYENHDKTQAHCNTLTLAKALNYSIKERVDIINLSLTGPIDPLLQRLVEKALASGIAVVGAAPAHNRPAFPVSIEGTIAVSQPGNRGSAIIAPGQKVLSTSPNNGYDFFDGSSFSSAHVAGLAALVHSVSPGISPVSLLNLFEQSNDSDTGLVSACRLVEELNRAGKTSLSQVVADNCG